MEIYLPKVVGKGYKEFWNFKGRYRVVKGSRASKKSKTTALWYIYNMMKYPEANLLVVRKTYRTLKESCYTELKWAVNRLGVAKYWDFKESPLQATYKPTGQKIYFRGLDDSLKVTSVTVEHGYLCWMWIEEAYEVMHKEDFDTIDESIRGEVPENLFKQVTITFNPWNERHWLKSTFFDNNVCDDDILAITTNYLCNEWLDKSDEKLFERMRVNNPRRYRTAGLGEWGSVEGVVYENWREQEFKFVTQAEYDAGEDGIISDNLKPAFGLDYGYTNDPSALFASMVDLDNHKIYVFDEFYKKGLSNNKIYNEIVNMGYAKERITADSSEPKSNDELKSYGLHVKGAKKGKDSVNNGIQWIQNFEIIVHPRCVNFITEISNYTWAKDKFGNQTNTPIDDFNHLMDAMRYGLEKYINSRKGWLI